MEKDLRSLYTIAKKEFDIVSPYEEGEFFGFGIKSLSGVEFAVSCTTFFINMYTITVEYRVSALYNSIEILPSITYDEVLSFFKLIKSQCCNLSDKEEGE